MDLKVTFLMIEES